MAIDPGTDKCGMALVRRDGEGSLHLLWRAVVPRGEVVGKVGESTSMSPHSLLIVGRGTGSKELVRQISDALPSEALLLVDEQDTTWQARERYWEHNPRKGWRRLLPASMQTPPEPVDDFVALILAERVLLV